MHLLREALVLVCQSVQISCHVLCITQLSSQAFILILETREISGNSQILLVPSLYYNIQPLNLFRKLT